MRLLRLGALFVALLVINSCAASNETSSLLLGGDVMLYRAGVPIFEDFTTGVSPWGSLVQIRNEDPDSLFAINLESPLGKIAPTGGTNDLNMNLCADESAVSILEQVNINLATTMNNHSGDCTGTDPSNTALVLDNAGISNQGEDSKILYLRLHDQIASFISFDEVTNSTNEGQILNLLRIARQKSELVVLSVHWGIEYQGGPSQSQEKLASEFVDAGADVIWGHHPHVLQPMEWMESSSDGHQALVMYSLGNLLSDQWMFPDALKTALVRIEFKAHQVISLRVIPLIMDHSETKLVIPNDEMESKEISDRLNLSGLERNGIKIELLQAKQKRN